MRHCNEEEERRNRVVDDEPAGVVPLDAGAVSSMGGFHAEAKHALEKSYRREQRRRGTAEIAEEGGRKSVPGAPGKGSADKGGGAAKRSSV